MVHRYFRLDFADPFHGDADPADKKRNEITGFFEEGHLVRSLVLSRDFLGHRRAFYLLDLPGVSDPIRSGSKIVLRVNSI